MTKQQAVDKLVKWLEEQVGYKEKPTNVNKYAEYLDKIVGFYNGMKNGHPWCDVFVDCGFVQCFGKDDAMKMLYQPEKSLGAGCEYSAKYYKEHNAYHYAPEVGDQYFAKDYNHTGVVVKVTANNIVTIEGNWGDKVAKRTIKRDDPYLIGYGRPDWDVVVTEVIRKYTVKTGDTLDKIAEQYDTTAEKIAKENGITNPNFITTGTVLVFRRGDKTWHTTDIFCQMGDRNKAVSVIQALLLKRGLQLTYDGYFGAETRSAVMTWQRSKGITVDGIVGDETIATL